MTRFFVAAASRALNIAIMVAAAFNWGCTTVDTTQPPDEPATGSLNIDSISCRFTHADGFGNRYFVITYSGRMTATTGTRLQLSSPDFGAGTKYTSDCGGWTAFSWSFGFPGCERTAGQPESITWRASSDLWIANQTHRQEALAFHPQRGELARVSRSIRCV